MYCQKHLGDIMTNEGNISALANQLRARMNIVDTTLERLGTTHGLPADMATAGTNLQHLQQKSSEFINLCQIEI